MRQYSFLLRLFFIAAIIGVPMTGLSVDAAAQTPEKTTTSADSETAYAKLAQDTYAQAEQAYKDGDYDNARQIYTYVRNRYPYSRYAALSELRIGDTYFQKEDYASAIEQYRGFIRLYPNNPSVPYAAFQTSQAFYKGMPGDSIFILPPSYEIDRSKATLAEREIKYFLERYPNTQYEDEARKALRYVQRRLADHELYAAKFYMKHDNFLAGSWRLKYLLEHYPGVGLDDQALILLAHCDIKLKDMQAAFNALKDLVQYHQDSPYYARAKAYLDKFDH